MNPDYKFFSKCFRCKKRRLFISKRTVKLPIGTLTAKSRELFCGKCSRVIKNELTKQTTK